MATSDPTAIPDPSPRPQTDGPTLGRMAQSPARLVYWSLRRELWENRFIYIVPLIVAAVFLIAAGVGAIHVPLKRADGSAVVPSMRGLEGPYDFAAFVLMLTYLVVAVIYCLGSLHNERQDRSILFWKSLPVSDVTTVLAKASIPIIVIPLITFAILVVTQGIMFLAGGAVLSSRDASVAGLWWQVPLLSMWAAMLYHLLTVHALYYAPVYGWFMLVSGWARRAVFLWAILPVVAILIIEKLVFNTAAFAHLLLSRLAGGPATIPFPPPGHMPMAAPTLSNLGSFLVSPGLWIGFAVCAVFLAAAVQLRKHQGPI